MARVTLERRAELEALAHKEVQRHYPVCILQATDVSDLLADLTDAEAEIAKVRGALKEARDQVVGFMIQAGYTADQAKANVSRLDRALVPAGTIEEGR